MKGGNSKSDSRNSKLSVTKKPTKASKAAAKDPNKPKRPASAFFVFMRKVQKRTRNLMTSPFLRLVKKRMRMIRVTRRKTID
ncbi:unnamed protein product [Eruca vesicaria subsp. sativa]|uniref:Uncharacterized protein n=1 Tax=Eruca vesicaria subsp. sativa TaxID=29727 RepID=A0ABC8JXA8_ERUVS|nr:unnamed protein product [Eruca vesicaria subsp. sativa]